MVLNTPFVVLSAMAALSSLVTTQTVTITRNICSTSSIFQQTVTTSAISTVIVPPTDQDYNQGTPFLIRVNLPTSYGSRKRQSSKTSYLLLNGSTTYDVSAAAQYRIVNGRLLTPSGTYVSASIDQSTVDLGGSAIVSAISTTFYTMNGNLVWKNGNFTGGFAQFYSFTLPPSTRAKVVAKLGESMGYIDGIYSAVSLGPVPVRTDMPYTSQTSSGNGYGNPTTTTTSRGNYGYSQSSSMVDMSTMSSNNPVSSSANGDNIPSTSMDDYNDNPTSTWDDQGSYSTPYEYQTTDDYEQVSTDYTAATTTEIIYDTTDEPMPTDSAEPIPTYSGEATTTDAYSDETTSAYSDEPTYMPSDEPTYMPSDEPTFMPSDVPMTITNDESQDETSMTVPQTTDGYFPESSSVFTDETPMTTTEDGGPYVTAPVSSDQGMSITSDILSQTSDPVIMSTTSPGPATDSGSPYTGTSFYCPDIDNTIVTDTTGFQYKTYCKADSNGQYYKLLRVQTGGIRNCLVQCSQDTNCKAASFVGAAGQDAGSCYLKSVPGLMTSSASDFSQFAIKVSEGSPQSDDEGDQESTMSSPTSSPASSMMSQYVPESTMTTTTSSQDTSSTPSNVALPPYSQDGTAMRCVILDKAADEPTDDGYCVINLPFSIQLFNQSSNVIYPNINGYITLDEPSSQYDPNLLPDDQLPPSTIAPFYDDFYLYPTRHADATPTDPDSTMGDYHGIYYTISPSSQSLNVTWILSRGGTFETYIFSLLYKAASKGQFVYTYRVTGGAGSGSPTSTNNGGENTDTSISESSNDGATAAIGLQGYSSATEMIPQSDDETDPNDAGNGDPFLNVPRYDYIQWSYGRSGAVVPGSYIVCDTIYQQGSTNKMDIACKGSDGTRVDGKLGSLPSQADQSNFPDE